MDKVNIPDNMEQQPICMDNLCFAATCSSCGYYQPSDPSSGWCSLHGGWVSPDKWTCSDYV